MAEYKNTTLFDALPRATQNGHSAATNLVDVVNRTERQLELGNDSEPRGGMLAEDSQVMGFYLPRSAPDGGLLAAAQAVEHYEITRYGTLKRWATVLGLNDAARLLDETLSEESSTDESLTAIADAAINAEALRPAA